MEILALHSCREGAVEPTALSCPVQALRVPGGRKGDERSSLCSSHCTSQQSWAHLALPAMRLMPTADGLEIWRITFSTCSFAGSSCWMILGSLVTSTTRASIAAGRAVMQAAALWDIFSLILKHEEVRIKTSRMEPVTKDVEWFSLSAANTEPEVYTLTFEILICHWRHLKIQEANCLDPWNLTLLKHNYPSVLNLFLRFNIPIHNPYSQKLNWKHEVPQHFESSKPPQKY